MPNPTKAAAAKIARRLGILAAAAALSVVTACSDGPGKAASDENRPAAGDSESVDTDGAPVSSDDQALRDVVTTFYERRIPRVYEQLDTAPLDGIVAPDSDVEWYYDKDVSEVRKRRHRYASVGTFDVRDFATSGQGDATVDELVTLTLHHSGARLVDATGAVVENRPENETRVTVGMVERGDDWLVATETYPES